MVERFLIVLLLIMIGAAAYAAFRQAHLHRLNRVAAAVGQPLLLYFGSDSCAACPVQARYLDELAQRWHGRLAIRKIDAGREPEKAAAYGVFTLPTTVIVDEMGVVQQVNYGLTSAHKLGRQVADLQVASSQ
ncbi:MAG TPA: thioredoxin family protein [Anaerolineae bacterium]